MPKGKNVLAIMLGGKQPKKKRGRSFSREEPEEVEEDDSDYSVAFQESAEEALGAINSGDTETFASALKDAIVTCVEEHNSGEY